MKDKLQRDFNSKCIDSSLFEMNDLRKHPLSKPFYDPLDKPVHSHQIWF